MQNFSLVIYILLLLYPINTYSNGSVSIDELKTQFDLIHNQMQSISVDDIRTGDKPSHVFYSAYIKSSMPYHGLLEKYDKILKSNGWLKYRTKRLVDDKFMNIEYCSEGNLYSVIDVSKLANRNEYYFGIHWRKNYPADVPCKLNGGNQVIPYDKSDDYTKFDKNPLFILIFIGFLAIPIVLLLDKKKKDRNRAEP